MQDEKLISTLCRDCNLVCYGSSVYDFYGIERITNNNDIDLAGETLCSEKISKNFKNTKIIYSDNNFEKLLIQNKSIEIFHTTIIPNKYIKEYNGIKIPEYSWSLISKILQFLYFSINEYGTDKTNKVYKDLCNLATSKSINWFSYKKNEIEKITILSLVQSCFYWHFSPDKGIKTKFELSDLKRLEKLFDFNRNKKLKKVLKTIYLSKKIKEVNHKIRDSLINKNRIYKRFYKFNKNSVFNPNDRYITFDNKNSLGNYFSEMNINKKYKFVFDHFNIIKDKSETEINLKNLILLEIFNDKK
ncbi:MAG4530 family protein [Mycoplasmopsis columboralis]|uniref:Uncharacterized protein n=1 Tax=Mycoplasmopsis columboralis TaxID=171282 RepID=A0A449B711_9BACT|nr:hypothetical protein [Mycoplasmopsis columboralis]VEU76373.1 Uncharacterised protein [Mycoplasmopsis columboralis]